MGNGLKSPIRASVLSARRGLLDNPKHLVRAVGLLERLAEFFFVKELGDIGQRVEMLLELTLRHEEEHDQVDWLIVQGIEIDPSPGTAEGAHDFVDQVGGGMWYPDAEPDAGAHGGLAFFDHGRDGGTMFGFDLAALHEGVEEFINSLPSISSPQFRDDLFSR